MLRRVCKLLGFDSQSFQDADENIILDQGNTVPTDATAGYAVGALFMHRDGGEGTAIYVNEGSESSCDFNAVAALTATQEALIGATAGTVAASKALIVDAYKTARWGGFNTGAALTDAVAFATVPNSWSDGQYDVAGFFGGTGSDMGSGASCKVIRARHVCQYTSVAAELYGVVGQLVVRASTLTHLGAGIMGTFEGHTSGVVLNSAYSIGHAAVIARIGGHATITATKPLAGFLAFNNASAALAGSTISVAFGASGASASYPWSVGLYLPVGSVIQGIRLGNWAGSAATGSAIPISAATDSADASQRNLVACYGESTADLGSGIHANVGRFRHLVNGITCNHETYGLVGQIACKTVTFAHIHAGLMGTFEVNTAATVPSGAGSYTCCAGVVARIGGATITVGSTGFLAGVVSMNIATTVSITSGGIHAAFACCKGGSGVTWAEALYVQDALVAMRFYAADNSYAHGVKALAKKLGDVNTSHCIKFQVGTTDVFVPGYAAEWSGT